MIRHVAVAAVAAGILPFARAGRVPVASVTVAELRVEYMTNPLGIDVARPLQSRPMM